MNYLKKDIKNFEPKNGVKQSAKYLKGIYNFIEKIDSVEENYSYKKHFLYFSAPLNYIDEREISWETILSIASGKLKI